MRSNRRYPGEYRFTKLAAIAVVEATREIAGRQSIERRYYIASAPLDPACLAQAVRAHWRIESAPQAQERKVRDELTDRAQAA